MKQENKIWLVYSLFVLSAIWDFGLTAWNLSHLGFHFEANPLGRNVWVILLIKFLACLTFLPSVYAFRKAEGDFFKQTIIISGFLVLIIGQVYGGYTHISTLKAYYQADQVVSEPNGSITFNVHGAIITYNVGSYVQNSISYLKTISVLLVYPYVYSLLVTFVTLWVIKKEDKKKQNTLSKL